MALTVAGAVLIGLLVFWASGADETAPELTSPQDLPDDVEAEVDAAWLAFSETFTARKDCIGDVELLLVDEVDGGDARYLAREARIEIAIPTSPRRFRDSLVHELAHHVVATCPAAASLDARFAELPGVGSEPDRWAERPSELLAETVVQLVLGVRVRYGRTVDLPPGAIDLVAGWAAG